MKYPSLVTRYSLLLLALLICLQILANAAVESTNSTPDLAPWIRPRELSNFQTLLQHSPFSLATAEESSPLSERYAITGIISIDGEDQVFIFDRNDQSRELLTKKANAKSMTLIGIVHDPDPNKLKATIRVNGETGVVSELEPTTNNPTMMGPQRLIGPGGPAGQQKNVLRPPQQLHYPGPNQPAFQNQPGMPPGNFNNPNSPNNPNNRRVITRPPISGQPANQPANSSYPSFPAQPSQ